MSVSEQAVEGLTKLVKTASLHYVNVTLGIDEPSYAEREQEASIIEALALHVKQLQLEVVRLERRIEDVCGKSPR